MVFYAVLSLPYKFSLHVNNNFNSNKKKIQHYTARIFYCAKVAEINLIVQEELKM